MPGFVHQRAAAVLADNGGQGAAAFHVEQDVGAGAAAEQILGKQHEQAIGPDDFAAVGDHSHAVAVAIERQAQVFLLHDTDQVGQVVRVAGVWGVVGEVAIDLGVQRRDVTAQLAEEARASSPVTPLPQSMAIFRGGPARCRWRYRSDSDR